MGGEIRKVEEERKVPDGVHRCAESKDKDLTSLVLTGLISTQSTRLQVVIIEE